MRPDKPSKKEMKEKGQAFALPDDLGDFSAEIDKICETFHKKSPAIGVFTALCDAEGLYESSTTSKKPENIVSNGLF